MAIPFLYEIPLISPDERIAMSELTAPLSSTYAKTSREESGSCTSIGILHVLRYFVRLESHASEVIRESPHGQNEPGRILSCQNSSCHTMAYGR